MMSYSIDLDVLNNWTKFKRIEPKAHTELLKGSLQTKFGHTIFTSSCLAHMSLTILARKRTISCVSLISLMHQILGSFSNASLIIEMLTVLLIYVDIELFSSLSSLGNEVFSELFRISPRICSGFWEFFPKSKIDSKSRFEMRISSTF